MPWILFAASFVTGAIWMVGEHVLFWVGMETAALTDHRGKLGLVFLLVVTALLVATFAKQTGRTVAFSLSAMRQAFAAARDLGVLDNVLIAAAACELHPRAVTQAIETRGVIDALRDAGEAARAAGVRELPAIAIRGAVASGPDAPERALAAT